MATGNAWHEERQFGRTVGLILLALGAWYAYRGRFPAAVPFLVGIGGVLTVLGLVWPAALAYPYRAWMALAEVLAFISTRIILGVVFLLIFTPVGAVMRLTSWDPLNRRAGLRGTYWVPYAPRQREPKHYERMF